MPNISMYDFKEMIKKEKLDSLYLLYGNESYMIRQFKNMIIDRTINKADRGFNYSEFSDNNFSAQSFYDTVEMCPMMSDKRCVVINNVDFSALSTQEYDNFKSVLEDIPDTAVVIIIAHKLDTTVFKTSKWKNIISMCEKVGVCVETKPLKNNEISSLIVQRVKKAKGQISATTASFLVERLESDIDGILSETDKLIMYAQGNEITKKNITDVVCSQMSSKAYELTRAIYNNNFKTAMEKIEDLINKKEDPIVLISIISSTFIDTYRVKIAGYSSRDKSVLKSDYDYGGKEFRLNGAFSEARTYSLSFLRKVISMLSDADERLKSSKINMKIELERLMMSIFMERAKEARR